MDDYSKKLAVESQSVETLASHLAHHLKYAQIQFDLLQEKLKLMGLIQDKDSNLL